MRAGVARLALPVVGDLVAAAGLDVAVEAVVGDVELAADEPLGERQVPLEDRVPRLVPVEELAAPARPRTPPESALGLVVDDGSSTTSAFGDELRRRERAVLGEQRSIVSDFVRSSSYPAAVAAAGIRGTRRIGVGYAAASRAARAGRGRRGRGGRRGRRDR